MSKKKMRAFAGAMAVVLAFVPFLSGCAANDAEDNPQAQQELNADEQSRNEAEGSIAEAVREALRKHARFLIERGVAPTVDVDEDVRVFADVKWLAFVIGQLVANAGKYGASTLRFSVREEGAGTSDARTVLEVADDGWGVPAGDVPRVFERAFTGENGRRAGSSTGMGLYLVAELCAKMGLAVALASEEGKGTRVLLAFPHDRRKLDLLS